ncbi:Homeobox domain protein [Spraguea lophii 42_110]|uniref:Homeobox domain protein n=1 Tax=Spraguea lophii (strain 42_110) TaxID=1358809 RepID=S7WCB8_SPRLO|nr:Homeobox domain protein [Spraguea lophii 42_110]
MTNNRLMSICFFKGETLKCSLESPVMGRNSPFKAVKFIDSTHEVLKSYHKPKSNKRPRTKLSENQISILEDCFNLNHHPNTDLKESIAMRVGIPMKNVQIWFQNRRAKDKNIKENAEIKMKQEQNRPLFYKPGYPNIRNISSSKNYTSYNSTPEYDYYQQMGRDGFNRWK